MTRIPQLLLTTLLAALILAGCAGQTSRKPQIEVFPDMDRQPKYKAQAAGAFFDDGQAARLPVSGTVAQGQLKSNEAFYTGVEKGMYVGVNPLGLSEDVLASGQERFNIYCAPCHDRAGTGRGIVGQKSLWLATNLNDDRIRKMADGELFEVITHGQRTMVGYRFQIPERDRWTIVAYIRALQRAASATVEDVPAELRRELR